MATGFAYDGVELRKLPPRFRLKLSQILDVDDAWKILMATIPSDQLRGESKYTMEHINLIERHGLTLRKLPCEILLDEWSTSGRTRPTVETLYTILQQCQLYRAADYLATEVLSVQQPPRPLEGPARSVPTPTGSFSIRNNNYDTCSHTASTAIVRENMFVETLLEKLNNHDYSKGNPINFDLGVIERATGNFSNPVGSGAFGTVFALDLKPKGPKLAVKLLHPTSTLIEDQFVTEIKVLSEYASFIHKSMSIDSVYEFMSGGTLLEAIAAENTPPLNWESRIEVMLGMIRGIHYLHTAKDKPLIHRDIKSSNILLEPTDGAKVTARIGDFGLAKSLNSTNRSSALVSTIFGTGVYMAPEAFRGDISPKMDVFSYGVILLELITGLPPYDEKREEGHDIVTYLEDQVESGNILPWLDDRAGNIDQSVPAKVYDITMRCLEDKRRRPQSFEILDEIASVFLTTYPQVQNCL